MNMARESVWIERIRTMLRKVCTGLTVVLVLLGCLGIASAQGKRSKAKKVRVAILPVKVQGLSVKTAKELGSVVVKELREIGVFRVVPGKVVWKKIRRLRKKKIFTKKCTEQKRCIRAVGRALRAKVLYFMSVTKKEEGEVNLSMRTFDVKSGKEVRGSSELTGEGIADLKRAARWVARRVSSPMITTLAKGKGKLRVNCEQPGANLYLNGKNFGKRTGKSFKVSSGVFDILVKAEGYGPFRDVVVVKPGQKQVVAAKLEPLGEAEPEPVEVAAMVPEEPVKKKERKLDLPPWAVFEKKEPKPKKIEEKPEGTAPEDEKKAAGGIPPWQQIAKSQAYLPDPKEKPEPTRREETKFYEAWWFWTATVAVVAGAGGTAAWYFLLREEGPPGYGAATITWQ